MLLHTKVMNTEYIGPSSRSVESGHVHNGHSCLTVTIFQESEMLELHDQPGVNDTSDGRNNS